MVEMLTFVQGPIDANNYLLIDEKTKDALLIDCSSPADDYINEIKRLGVNLKKILLTHGHFDHILGCNRFCEEFGAEIYINAEDIAQIEYAPEMTMLLTGVSIPHITSIKNKVKEGDKFKIGDVELTAISTPGHTLGGMCYYTNDGRLFSGDTLFKRSVGRTDFIGGNLEQMKYSIKEKLFKLPDDTVVYSGHGPETTIGYEKKYNELI